MSSFKRFLEEAEYASRHPIPGDQFDIVLASGRLIETRVVKLVDDGFVVESLQARSGEQDSDSPIPGQDGKEDQELTGRMSPINGHAFTDYDINKNPRKWFTRAGTPSNVKHKQVRAVCMFVTPKAPNTKQNGDLFRPISNLSTEISNEKTISNPCPCLGWHQPSPCMDATTPTTSGCMPSACSIRFAKCARHYPANLP
jgi:hypothetical protein